MGVSARIFASILLLSFAAAVPAGSLSDHFQDGGDLSAESSEIIADAVPAPSQQDHETAAATGLNDHSIELVGGSQTFFPSFANLFEPRQHNFRLGFGGSQEGAYSQRPNSYRSLLNYPLFGSYRNLDSGFAKPTPAPAAAPAQLVDANSAILGSGNFGIIRGGTFLAPNDEDSDDYNDGFSFYNNGHGRPSLGLGYIANPRPNPNQDQFANFRDFADINAPANSAYSHFVVVYANKNATMDEVSEETRKVVSEPKNIFETLELLDKTEPKEVVQGPPKVSKAKSKLALTKQKLINKKDQWRKANSKSFSHKHDPEEPLLALS